MGSEYKKFDDTLNPNKDFKRPTLEQLKKGVKVYPKQASKKINSHGGSYVDTVEANSTLRPFIPSGDA